MIDKSITKANAALKEEIGTEIQEIRDEQKRHRKQMHKFSGTQKSILGGLGEILGIMK
ncbi:unnamed protein product, partial [Amoebophrya sp. A25]|eukprot:GSA25T00006054001.1